MSAYYSVIQLVPDPAADERVNIGVITYGDARPPRVRFLRDWRRVKAFAGQEISPLRDFAERVLEATAREPQLFTSPGQLPGIDAERVQTMADRWMNSIHITQPRASTRDPDSLLEEVSGIFLRERRRVKRVRDRRAAVRLAADALVEAIHDRTGEKYTDLVRRSVAVEGTLDTHTFDLAMRNGQLAVAAQGLSFEVPDSSELRRDVEATAWMIDDVRSAHGGLSLAVIALPPPGETATFRKAEHIFTGLKADFVLEPSIGEWARRAALLAN